MAKYQVTVIVANYNSILTKVKMTLKSILFQKNIFFEIVIVDDGSQQNYEMEIRQLLAKYRFKDYVLVLNDINQGTCKNVSSGLERARGEYIKCISPGDYLYNENVLAQWYSFMKANNVQVSFGDAVWYNHVGDRLNIVKHLNRPQLKGAYEAKNYNKHSVMLYYLILNDLILGASFFTESSLMKEYFRLIEGKVKYAEDNIYRLMVSDGIRIWYYPHKVIWYEFGTGISTSKNPKWFSRICSDLHETDKLIIQRCQFISFVNRYKRVMSMKRSHKQLQIHRRTVKKLLIFPELILTKIKQEICKVYTPQDVDTTFYCRLMDD